MRHYDEHRQTRRAFTLLELVTVLLVIAILATMLMPAYDSLRNKADRAKCTTNLKSLYVGAHAYLEQQQQWPQISTKTLRTPEYALAWIKALQPYGIARVNWICPTVQRQLKNPDYNNDKRVRVDYIATPFDANPRSPMKWPTQPWFVERGDVHGDGQLLIFTNGDVKSLPEAVRDTRGKVYDQ